MGGVTFHKSSGWWPQSAILFIAFSFFLSIINDSIICVAADFHLSQVLPDKSTERVDYSIFFQGVTKTRGHQEGENNPKEVASGDVFHVPTTSSQGLDHASLMGWDIGLATATNGRGYPNQDNFLIRLYSEPVEEAQANFRPTIGVFAIFDGHGNHGHLGSKVAAEVTRQYADLSFSNYTQLVEKSMMQIKQMAMFGGPHALNDTTKMEPKAVEQSIRGAIVDIYRQVEEGLMSGDQMGTTMTMIVWDLKQNKLYTASAGDSLSFKGNSKNQTLDLISADHGSDNPEEQTRARQAMQDYFSGILPRKSSYRGKTTVVWQTPGQYRGWPDELKGYRFVSPTDEGWIPTEQDNATLSERDETEEEEEEEDMSLSSTGEDSDFGEIIVGNQTLNMTSSSTSTLSTLAMIESTPQPVPSLLQLNMDATTGDAGSPKPSEEADKENTEEPSEEGVNPFMMLMQRMMALPSIQGQRIPPGQVPGFASLYYHVIPQPRGIFEEFRFGGLQPARSMGDGGKGPLINSAAFIRSDPEIKVYDLDDETLSASTDFILMTSDGFTNIHGTDANERVYSDRVQSCIDAGKKAGESGAPSKKCLDDPLRRYNEWYNSTEVFYPPYDKAHKEFSDAVDETSTASMYKLITDTMEKAKTLTEGAGKILSETLRIQSESAFPWNDDVTFIYIKRKPSTTSDKTIKQHSDKFLASP